MLLWSWCIFFLLLLLVLLHQRRRRRRRLLFPLSLKVKAVNCSRQQKEELYVAAIKDARACTFFARFGFSKLENHCLNTRCFCISTGFGCLGVHCDSNKRHESTTRIHCLRSLASWLSISFHSMFSAVWNRIRFDETFTSISSVIISDLLVQSNQSQMLCRDQ